MGLENPIILIPLWGKATRIQLPKIQALKKRFHLQ
jgi:hypothetical protein